MPSGSEVKFEIGHVLFIDIVGYSKLLITEQSEQIQKLKEIVRGTEQVRITEAEGKLLRLPTGDGAALVFRTTPEAPVLCAMQISNALKSHPEIHVRMGIHSGPVNEVSDLNAQANIAGAGINIAQRVMDCGDAGHILLSRRVAEDLEHYPRWRPCLHRLGEIEVKHGDVISVVNLYQDELGNPNVPQKFRTGEAAGLGAKHQAKGPGLCLRRWIIGGLIGTAIVFLVLGLLKHQRKSAVAPRQDASAARTEAATGSTSSQTSIAVLPFVNISADKNDEYLSDGMTEELISVLSKVPGLCVPGRTSCFAFKGRNEDDIFRKVGDQLHVGTVLEGSVRKAGDKLRVTAQLINVSDGYHLWSKDYDGDVRDILNFQTSVAEQVVQALQVKLGGEETRALAKKSTENPEAHELYLKGRYFWNRRTAENLKKAADYFQQAIGKDPQYALAYSGLADCHVLLPLYPELGSNPRDELPKALTAARKAVELDDTLAEVHASLARALASNLQLSPAISEFNRAIELNPNYATAHQWFGECLQSQGRVKEGLAELTRAQELDPLSLVIDTLLGFAFDTVGKSDEAIAQLRKTIETDPNFGLAHGYFGNVLEHNGQLEEAIVEYEKSNALQAEPFNVAQLARAYFLVGRKAEAQQLWDKLKSLSERQYVPAYAMAVAQLAFGNKDEAIRLLDKSYEDHAPFDSADLGWILVDHRLDPLRSDPRFKKLITRIFSGERR